MSVLDHLMKRTECRVRQGSQANAGQVHRLLAVFQAAHDHSRSESLGIVLPCWLLALLLVFVANRKLRLGTLAENAVFATVAPHPHTTVDVPKALFLHHALSQALPRSSTNIPPWSFEQSLRFRLVVVAIEVQFRDVLGEQRVAAQAAVVRVQAFPPRRAWEREVAESGELWGRRWRIFA
jgi:hypothetical protein